MKSLQILRGFGWNREEVPLIQLALINMLAQVYKCLNGVRGNLILANNRPIIIIIVLKKKYKSLMIKSFFKMSQTQR